MDGINRMFASSIAFDRLESGRLDMSFGCPDKAKMALSWSEWFQTRPYDHDTAALPIFMGMTFPDNEKALGRPSPPLPAGASEHIIIESLLQV